MKFKNLYAVKKFRDHQHLLKIKGPAIIIAGSGMCTGGRIVDHLKTGLGRIHARTARRNPAGARGARG